MKYHRNKKPQRLFENYIITENAREYFIPDTEEELYLNDSLYPGGENNVIRREELRGMERLPWYMGFVAVVFLIFLAQSWNLQIFANQKYTSDAERYRTLTLSVNAPRGVIYDTNKTILAKNIPSFSVYITQASLPTDPDEREDAFKTLGNLIDLPADTIRETLHAANLPPLTPILIKRKIDRATAMRIELSQREFPGVLVKSDPIREYAVAPSLGHIIGYVGAISAEEREALQDKDYDLNDVIGKNGVEAMYEDTLRGSPGKEKIEVNNRGYKVRTLKPAEPESGENITLTIDVDLQQRIGEILEKHVRRARAEEGAGIAILQDVNTGAILSMVSYPYYDNNLFAQGLSNEQYQNLISPESKMPLFHRAVSGIYPPGSVFKPFVAAAALQEGNITPYTKINDIGFFYRYGTRFTTWRAQQGLSPEGWINVTQALERSNNIFFYAVAGGAEEVGHPDGIGSDTLATYLQQFGFGKKAGIDLTSESSGTLPSAANPPAYLTNNGKDWRIGDTYLMSIGQGFILSTPLQLVNATSALANGGKLYRPHVLSAIGNVEQQPEVMAEGFIDQEHLRTVRQGMLAVTQNRKGTAVDTFGDFAIVTGGKTGTAQYKNNTREHAWFSAFAPYDNPEVALVVLIEGGGEGSKRAAPAAREILEYYFLTYKREQNTIMVDS